MLIRSKWTKHTPKDIHYPHQWIFPVYPDPLGKPADPRYESLANFANLQLHKEYKEGAARSFCQEGFEGTDMNKSFDFHSWDC